MVVTFFRHKIEIDMYFMLPNIIMMDNNYYNRIIPYDMTESILSLLMLHQHFILSSIRVLIMFLSKVKQTYSGNEEL